MDRGTELERLTRQLAAERGITALPKARPEKRRLLRALMNTRPPVPIDETWLRRQDAFLRREALEKGVVNGPALPAVPGEQRLALWRGDITRLWADAIVNAANEQMLGCFVPCHGCIDNAIHSAAGLRLRLECKRQMDLQGGPEPTGSARLTPGYALPARYVIHTVGPIVRGTLTREKEEQLAGCYRACMKTAAAAGCRCLAFCCVSTGEFGFPARPAAEIAVKTVKEELGRLPSLERVIFNVFKASDEAIYRELLGTAGAAEE